MLAWGYFLKHDYEEDIHYHVGSLGILRHGSGCPSNTPDPADSGSRSRQGNLRRDPRQRAP